MVHAAMLPIMMATLLDEWTAPLVGPSCVVLLLPHEGGENDLFSFPSVYIHLCNNNDNK